MEGFIRGGSNGGVDVDLMAVMPADLRMNSNQQKQDAWADAYEARNGIVVIRPRETPAALADLPASIRREIQNQKNADYSKVEEIAAERRRQIEQALADRRARVHAARTVVPEGEETMGMSPEQAERQLRILMRQPNPDVKTQVEIHKLQQILKIEATDFSPIRKKIIDKQNAELAERLAKYQGLEKKGRMKVVEGITSLSLLALIRDTEADVEIQNRTVSRIAELEFT